jgi:hypothetical protein
MENILKMAGEYASHAVWSVSTGEILIPIVGFLSLGNSHKMERLAMGSVEAMAVGDRKISELDSDKLGAVFIKDAMVTLDSGKTDALVIDIRFAEDTNKKMEYILPYRNANHSDGFAVHRLKLSKLEGISQDDIKKLTEAFFDGLESHPQGGKIWNEKYVDQAGVSTGHYGDECTEFSQQEFESLKQSPFLIFFLVAAADGKVDKKELIEFVKLLAEPEKFNNPLLNRIITNVINDIPSAIASMAQQQIDYIDELGKLKTIIDNKLSSEEANAFKVALLLVGKGIAEASGGFLGFGSKISKEEKIALAAIALCLEISSA